MGTLYEQHMQLRLMIRPADLIPYARSSFEKAQITLYLENSYLLT